MSLAAKNFIVYALPRSRTAWLADFLGKPGEPRGHDSGIMCDTLGQFYDAVRSGTVETGAQDAWEHVRQNVPEVKEVVVLRPLPEVLQSLAKQGISGQPVAEEMARREAVLQRIARDPRVKVLRYGDMCSKLYNL